MAMSCPRCKKTFGLVIQGAAKFRVVESSMIEQVMETEIDFSDHE